MVEDPLDPPDRDHSLGRSLARSNAVVVGVGAARAYFAYSDLRFIRILGKIDNNVERCFPGNETRLPPR